MADIAELGFRVDSSQVRRAVSDMERMERASKSLENMVKRAFAGIGGALLLRETIRMADAYTNLTSKIRNVTRDEGELMRVRSNLFAISQKTRGSFESTVELYARMTRATKSLGLSEQDRLRITETVNKAAIVSGANAVESSKAIIQLSQGLGAGALRGEEFNSVAEQMPIILDLISKSSGIAREDLKKMGAEGKITADLVTKALLEGSDEIDKSFSNIKLTVGSAFQVLQNSILQFVGTTDEGSEVSLALANAIVTIAEAIDLVSPQLNALVGMWTEADREQKNSVTSAHQIAQVMKGVVTGIVLAKNAVEVFISALEALGKIGLATVNLLVGNFKQLGDVIVAFAKRLTNPFEMFNDAEFFGNIFASQEKLLREFTASAGVAIDEFSVKAQEDVNDVSRSFDFLLNPLKAVELQAANTSKGVRTLGTNTSLTAKEVEKIDKAMRKWEDILGSVQSAIDPIKKAQEEHNKLVREATAHAEKLIKLTGKEAEIREQLRKAIEQSAANRDREIAAIREEQGAVDKLLTNMQAEIDLIGMGDDAREKAIATMEAEERMLEAIEKARAAGLDITEDQAKGYLKLARAMAVDTVEARKLESVLSRFDDLGFKGLLNDIELLKEALREALGKGAVEDVERLTAAITRTKGEALLFATDAIGQGISSLKSMATEGTRAYKALEIAQKANNVVAAIGAILNQANGDPYTAFARMAAMAAAVAQLVGSLGGSFGNNSSSAASRQESQGTGTVLGDAEAKSESIAEAAQITADATSELVGISRGMLNALQAMQRGISGASAGIARTQFEDVSLAQGAGLGFSFSLADRLVSSIFGGEQELIDQGLLIRGGGFSDVAANPRASAYQTIETDGGWFSGDDIDDTFQALGESAVTQIQLILRSIADTVREGALALGGSAEEIDAAIEAFRIEEIRISTMGLSGEETQRELQAAFSAIFDGLAGAVVPYIVQFQQVGEGLGETLVRVATSVQVTQEAIFQLGLSIGTLDPERMAQVSVALVEAAGGIDAFIQGMQSFVNNFAPEAHKFTVAQDELTRALGQVGLTLPTTREGFWDLMQSIDGTTASGAQQIATLLRLSSVAHSYYSTLESQAEDTADAARVAAQIAEDAAREALEQARAAQSLLIGITNDRAYSQMSTAERAIADVNRRFSDLRIALNETNPSLEEAGRLERERLQALEDANAALMAQGQALVSDLLWEESLVGMTEVQRSQAEINKLFDDYVAELLDLGFAIDSVEIVTLNQIRANRLLRAETEAATAAIEAFAGAVVESNRMFTDFFAGLLASTEKFKDPGFRRWIEELTGFAPAVNTAMVSRAAILTQIDDAYAAQIASMVQTRDHLQTQLNAAMVASGGINNSLTIGLSQQLLAITQAIAEVGGALGDALDYVHQLFDEQIGTLLGDLRREFGQTDPIADINARFDLMIAKLVAWGATAEQIAEVNAFRQIALQQQIADANEERYRTELDNIRHLQGFLDGMLLGEDSPLSHTQRTQEAWDQLQDAVAMGNAQEATRLADVYLRLLRESQASGEDFNSQFWAVRDLLTAMRDATIQSITDSATEQYLADIAAGGVLQLHALERLTAIMESIRVATGGVLIEADPVTQVAMQSYASVAMTDPELSTTMLVDELTNELALLREEVTALRSDVRAGSKEVATTVDKTGERSDRNNDVSRSRYANSGSRGRA